MSIKINWEGKNLPLSTILKQEGISKTTFYRTISQKNLTTEEALIYCLDHKKEVARTQDGKGVYEVAKEEGLTPTTIYKYISKGKTIEEAVVLAKENIKKHQVISGKVKVEGMNLNPYCTNMGYNYHTIDHAIREQGMNEEEAIQTYQKEGQKLIVKKYKYQVYGILLKHLLLYYCLDSNSGIKQMIEEEKLSIEELMIRKVFQKKELTGKKVSGKKLQEMYDLLESCTEEEQEEFKDLFDMDQETIELLKKKKELILEIKRDLKYLEFYDMLSICSEEEKEEALEVFGMKEEDFAYIKNEFYQNFEEVLASDGKTVYVKKPNAVSRKSGKLTNR